MCQSDVAEHTYSGVNWLIMMYHYADASSGVAVHESSCRPFSGALVRDRSKAARPIGPAERAEPFTQLGAPSRLTTGPAERAESFTLLGRPSAPTNLTTEHASRKEGRARRPTGRAERAEPATPQNYRSRELFKRENGAVL